MKPNWDDAPEWANYVAQDQTGKWYWYSHQPIASEGYWAVPQDDGRWDAATVQEDAWKDTLRARP
jgi:hypothetical protein